MKTVYSTVLALIVGAIAAAGYAAFDGESVSAAEGVTWYSNPGPASSTANLNCGWQTFGGDNAIADDDRVGASLGCVDIGECQQRRRGATESGAVLQIDAVEAPPIGERPETGRGYGQ